MTIAILLIVASAIASTLLMDAPAGTKAWVCLPTLLLATIGLVATGGMPLPDGIMPNAAQLMFMTAVVLIGTTILAITLLDLPASGKVVMGAITLLTLPGWLMMAEAVTRQPVFG